MTESPQFITEFLDRVFSYGAFWVYLAIFLASFIENIVPPFPGDTFILIAGGLVAVSKLELAVVFPIIIIGGVSSAMIWYLLGRRYGHDYFLRKNFRFFSAADVRRMEARIDRWGPWALICSRLVVGVRIAIAAAAGIGQYDARKTVFYLAMAYVIYAGLLLLLGMFLADNLDIVLEYIRTYHVVFWIVLLIAIISFVVYRYRRMKRNSISS
jgi:membrane protein DedA with SNARE-associated domain